MSEEALELKERVGGKDVIDFMESNGFKFTVSTYNKDGYWFNEKDQMTEGLSQAKYMFGLIKAHTAKITEEIIGEPVDYKKLSQCPVCNAPHMYRCTCDQAQEILVNQQLERLKQYTGERVMSKNITKTDGCNRSYTDSAPIGM